MMNSMSVGKGRHLRFRDAMSLLRDQNMCEGCAPYLYYVNGESMNQSRVSSASILL